MISIDRAACGLVLHVDEPGSPEVVLGAWLGEGQEAAIFRVPGWRDGRWAAKVYRRPDDAAHKEAKLRAMCAMCATLASTLQTEVAGEALSLVVWPDRLLRHSDGRLAGFLMRLVEPARTVALEDRTHVHRGTAGVSADDLSLPQRLRLCRNLAAIVAEVHARGHLVVDFKPGNLRVHSHTSIPCLMDTDGFSIATAGGHRFPADAATPEFASPEVLRGLTPLRELTDDTHDRFALAVILFQSLNTGIHPFQGVSAVERTSTLNADGIRDGLYAYGLASHADIAPTPGSLHETFPTALREFFDQALAHSAAGRPTAAAWRDLLDRVLCNPSLFVRCPAAPSDPLHIHFAGAPCPQCAWEEMERQHRAAAAALARGALDKAGASAGTAATGSPASPAPASIATSTRRRRARRIAVLLLVLVAIWLMWAALSGHWPPSLPFMQGA